MIRSTALLGPLSLLAVLAAGCTGEETAVSVQLYTAEGVLHDRLLTDGPADTLELVLEAEGDPYVENFDLAAGRGSVTSVPTGEGYRFTVRGFRGQEATVFFYGASGTFDVDPGDSLRIPVQVGAADCIGLNRAAPTRDPADGGTADLQDRRVGASFTALADGRVLILGGAEIGPDGTPVRILDTAEIFDPVHNQVVKLPWRLVLPRAWHSATLLPDGEVLVVGGVVGIAGAALTVTDTAALIEPDEIEAVRPFAAPIPAEGRAHHQATALPDGSVLIAGGESGDGTPLATVVRFAPPAEGDPISGRFRVQGPLHQARTRFTQTATLQGNNPALAAGGRAASGPASAIELFTLNTAQQGCVGGGTPTDDVGCFIRPSGVQMRTPRWGHGAALVEDGRAIVFVGGYATADRSRPVAEVTRLNMRDFNLRPVGELATPRGELAVAAVDDGGEVPYVVVVGGRVGDDPLIAASRLVPNRDASDPTNFLYTDTPVADGCGLSEPRAGLAALNLDSRTVLLVGGYNRSPAGLSASRRVELFFPRINAF